MKLINLQISNEQRGMIYGLAKKAGLNNEQLHEHIEDWAGVTSLKTDNCTSNQAKVIIDCLKKLVPGGYTGPKNRDALSSAQYSKIKHDAAALGWNDSRLSGFMLHTAGKDNIADLSITEASKVITGLKKMGYTKKVI